MLYAALKRRSSTVLRASAVAAESESRVKGKDNIKVKGKSKIKVKGKSNIKVKGVGQECPTHTSEGNIRPRGGWRNAEYLFCIIDLLWSVPIIAALQILG